MALPLLRRGCCCRLPSLLRTGRPPRPQRLFLTRPGAAQPAPVGALSSPHCYSSDAPRPHQKVMVLGIPNPIIWVRTRFYYLLIRAYFDKEFRIEEFTEGAKQVGLDALRFCSAFSNQWPLKASYIIALQHSPIHTLKHSPIHTLKHSPIHTLKHSPTTC